MGDEWYTLFMGDCDHVMCNSNDQHNTQGRTSLRCAALLSPHLSSRRVTHVTKVRAPHPHPSPSPHSHTITLHHPTLIIPQSPFSRHPHHSHPTTSNINHSSHHILCILLNIIFLLFLFLIIIIIIRIPMDIRGYESVSHQPSLCLSFHN